MLAYKFDVLAALREKGFNTTRLRKEKLLAESTIQKLREKRPIAWQNINEICRMLDCQPGDFLEYIPETEEQQTE
jgi:putative transcriptional regulator